MIKKFSKKYSLSLKILISKSSSIFYKKEIKLQYKFIQAEETYLFLKKNPKNDKIISKSNQYILNSDEDEILICYIKFPENDNIIELYNPWDKCYKCDLEKLYNNQFMLDYKLWKSIPKLPNEDDYDYDEYDENIYIHNLKENDIIRLGNVKLILREINISGYEDKNNNEKIFIAKLKDERNKGKKCSICNKGDLGPDNPLIALCNCKGDKKYKHYLCLKNNEYYKTKNDNDYNNDKCIRYYANNNCSLCHKFYPLSFYVEQDKENKYYEIIDIPRNKNEDYLLFETLEFKNKNDNYIKYIYYIKLQNNKEKIIIGTTYNEIYKNDIYIIIEDNTTISNQHALIEYDKEIKKLSLRNLSDSYNTLILQKKFILKQRDILNAELGNIKIEGKLINNDNINNHKKEWNENQDKIDLRERHYEV